MTDPSELRRFDSEVEAIKDDYNAVIDGLNCSLTHTPKVKGGIVHRSPVRNAEGKVRYIGLKEQSFKLLSTLKAANERGYKPLTIHRTTIFKYPHYKEIAQLSKIIVLDKL